MRGLLNAPSEDAMRASMSADYRRRMFANKDDWRKIMSALAPEQDYDNFRNGVGRFQGRDGEENADCLRRIWSIMYEYQNRQAG